jgi:hypothetical protein
MLEQDYCMSFDWRRAKFHLANPKAKLSDNETVVPSELSLFLSIERIDNVLTIRDWIHRMALHYRLLGHYVASECRGIAIEFENVADLALFQQQWQPVNA